MKFFKAPEGTSPVSAPVRYVLLGLVFGGLSLLVFPEHLLHPLRIPGISLVASPTVAGVMMSLTGGLFSRQDVEATQWRNFGYGFAFALGMAVVRFLFAK